MLECLADQDYCYAVKPDGIRINNGRDHRCVGCWAVLSSDDLNEIAALSYEASDFNISDHNIADVKAMVEAGELDASRAIELEEARGDDKRVTLLGYLEAVILG